MKNEEKAKVLSSESKPYDFQGNVGVSHKIRLNIEGEIFVVKTTEDQVNEFKKYVGQEGVVIVSFSSPKEVLKMTIDSFRLV